jgi:hypothetical protein
MNAVTEQKELQFFPEAQNYDCSMISVDEDGFMLKVYNKGYHPSINQPTHQYKKLKEFVCAMGEDPRGANTIPDLVHMAKRHLNKIVGGKFYIVGDYSVDVHKFFPTI